MGRCHPRISHALSGNGKCLALTRGLLPLLLALQRRDLGFDLDHGAPSPHRRLDDGIAIEIKYLSGSLDGLKQAIGQSIFYRVRYRFVMNVFVVAEKYKAANGRGRGRF